MNQDELLDRAAAHLASARALLIAAGAGMGVDSGLPDFRGTEGFWNAYPPYAKLGLQFHELANPQWFDSDPALAWGFYGHRLNLYRATKPHEGYHILRRWGERMPHGCFVYTSNVDGHFQAAGFAEDRVCEVHGSVHWMQCLRGCGSELFPSEQSAPAPLVIDAETFRAREPFPHCPRCDGLARPNILMFGDGGWEPERSYDQEFRLGQWLRSLGADGPVIVECGAGTGVPTVRRFSEAIAGSRGGRLIRINVREPEVPRGEIGLAMGALEALREIAARMA